MARRRLPPPPPGGRRAPLGIEFSGPFFEHDPYRTVRQNIRDLLDKVAAAGEAQVKRRMVGTRSAIHTRPYVVGRTRSLGGKRWAVTAVVSVNAADLGIGKRNPAAVRRMAIAAGRHNPAVVTRSGNRSYFRSIGTTKGAEGETKAFVRTKRELGRVMRAKAKDLTRGLN